MEEKVKEITVKVGDEEKVVEVHKPTNKIETEANMEASKVFTRLIKERDEDGKPAFMLRSQLNKFLADIGIYTEQDIEDITRLGERLDELTTLLQKGGIKKSEGRKAAIELRKVRYVLFSILAKSSEFDKNTVEAYADNARMDYLIVKCIKFKDGGQIFNNVADYHGDEVMQKVLRPAIEVLAAMVSQYDPDYEKKLPENKFLLKYGFCDNNYRLINAEGKYVDAEGNLVDEDGNAIVEDSPAVVDVGEFLEDE